jgi:hypothetical protein
MILKKIIMQSALLVYFIHLFSKLAKSLTAKVENFKFGKEKENKIRLDRKTIIIIEQNDEKGLIKMSSFHNGVETEKFIYQKVYDESDEKTNEISLPNLPIRPYRMTKKKHTTIKKK